MASCICIEEINISMVETCTVKICLVTTVASESRKQFVAFFNVQIFSFTVSFHGVSSGIEPVTVNGKTVLPL